MGRTADLPVQERKTQEEMSRGKEREAETVRLTKGGVGIENGTEIETEIMTGRESDTETVIERGTGAERGVETVGDDFCLFMD